MHHHVEPRRSQGTKELLVRSLAGLALALCCASGATLVAQSYRYGIVTQILNPEHAPLVSELGTGYVRLDFNWHEIEQRRGRFDWRALDERMSEARTRRLKVYGTLAYTPSWAAPAVSRLPADLADWRRFVRECMERYGSDVVYGIWNEPNLDRFLEDDAAGTAYKRLWQEAHEARLAVSERYSLGGPETSHHAMDRYFQSVMTHLVGTGVMLDHDKVTVHWYPDGPRLGRYMNRVHKLAGGREVWLTETGKATCDDAEQVRAYRHVLQEFTKPGRSWWSAVFFYVLHTSDACSEGIVRPDWQPRRAFVYYRSFIETHP
jgi:hypothetical protein